MKDALNACGSTTLVEDWAGMRRACETIRDAARRVFPLECGLPSP